MDTRYAVLVVCGLAAGACAPVVHEPAPSCAVWSAEAAAGHPAVAGEPCDIAHDTNPGDGLMCVLARGQANGVWMDTNCAFATLIAVPWSDAYACPVPCDAANPGTCGALMACERTTTLPYRDPTYNPSVTVCLPRPCMP